MAFNLANLCLLPPQDLLISYQLSQPVAIQVHQALAQFEQALSLDESVQVTNINTALQQLTPVEFNPIEEELCNNTNLK